MEVTMKWSKDTIAHYKQTITRLREGIERMQAGTLQVREFRQGKWVVINPGCIAQDELTLANLEEIVSHAEADVAAPAVRP